MKVQKYNNLQEQLTQNLNSKENLHRIIENNRSLINQIVETFGSGSKFLTKPYDDLYDSHNYDLASYYQTEIENINEVALFGEDG